MNHPRHFMLSNALIECAWLACMVTFAMHDKDQWGCVCLIGALFSGYGYKIKRKDTEE